jgi:hypothetical protein
MVPTKLQRLEQFFDRFWLPLLFAPLLAHGQKLVVRQLCRRVLAARCFRTFTTRRPLGNLAFGKRACRAQLWLMRL